MTTSTPPFSRTEPHVRAIEAVARRHPTVSRAVPSVLRFGFASVVVGDFDDRRHGGMRARAVRFENSPSQWRYAFTPWNRLRIDECGRSFPSGEGQEEESPCHRTMTLSQSGRRVGARLSTRYLHRSPTTVRVAMLPDMRSREFTDHQDEERDALRPVPDIPSPYPSRGRCG